MFDLQHLRAIRLRELDQVIGLIPRGAEILEIGGGTGWQAAELATHGFRVCSIDLADSAYASQRVFDVQAYDGAHIPFPDHSFDVVFSSNTLEHIKDVGSLLNEARRVLKPGGFGVHLMPTPAWRVWTGITYYPWLAGMAARALIGSRDSPANVFMTHARSKENLAALAFRALVPPRHGETGNALLEVGLFSRWRWQGVFREAGWSVERSHVVRLFYTGHSLFGRRLGLRVRERLARVLGGSCRLYVVHPHTTRLHESGRINNEDPVGRNSENGIVSGYVETNSHRKKLNLQLLVVRYWALLEKLAKNVRNCRSA